jgi:hypothetical protein
MPKSKKAHSQLTADKKKPVRTGSHQKKSGSGLDEFAFHDELANEEELQEEMLGELDEEDDEEFISKVKEFEKEHSKSRMINIYKKIGSPKFKKLGSLPADKLDKAYKDVVCLLDKENIIVHFHNEYPVGEKYRFITEEIFKEFVEDKKGKHHINFIYEDFHPEMDEDEDEADLY